MRKLLSTLCAALILAAQSFIAQPTVAQDLPTQSAQPGWMRYPSISPDGRSIAFTYRGDLYIVSASGGEARQLTQHEAHDFMPVWSHDSKQIAFASDRFGNYDVFVMPAGGGVPKRLSFHSAPEYPYSFSRDNSQVYFGGARLDLATNRQFPAAYFPELYKVPAAGGRVSLVLTTPAEYVQELPGGKLLYQDKKGQENDWRKHQVSSVARDCWIYDPSTGRHQRITSNKGEDRNPVPDGTTGRFYYLSEAGGSFNVYVNSFEKDQPRALTSFTRHPVRFLSRADNGTLCFGYDGQIYTMLPDGQPRQCAITIHSDLKKNAEQVFTVDGGAREHAVSPNGKELAFIFRGDVFVTSVEGGVTKRITATPEAERSVGFSADGRSLIYASERGDRWKIYQSVIRRSEEPYFYASTVVEERPVIANEHDNYQPQYSPDGKWLAFVEDRNRLKIMNLSSRTVVSLLGPEQLFSMSDNDQYFQWSPDSKWILFEYAMPGVANPEVGLVSADGKTIRNLSQSGFSETRARWILGGKAITWFSNRDGLSSRANSGGSQQDLYAAFIDQESWDRFRLNKEDAALTKDIEAMADSSKKNGARKDSLLHPDLEHLPFRKIRLTTSSAYITDARISKDGEQLYCLARFEKDYNMWVTNLRTRETKILATLDSKSASMQWDKDQKYLYLNTDGKLSKLDPVSGKLEKINIKGEISIDTDKERRSMFDHVWRRTRASFYTGSMHGVDWEAYRQAYEKYLPHISNGQEFSEMLSEMLGELNVSHSGSSYVGKPEGGDATASLGIFPDPGFSGKGIRIAEVLEGGPLDRAETPIKPGDVIVAIDNDSIANDRDWAFYLNRKAGKFTLLTVWNGKSTAYYRVKPVPAAEQQALLYRRWVKRNEKEVETLSKGNLGYVHIPGMNDGAYRNTYEEIMGRFQGKKGIVVDTRNNGGGDLVADLAMFLSGKKFLDYTTDTRSTGFEPSFRWTKPSISLVNECNYSDGHCYAYSYQYLEIGKLVGQPVPGTCTFAGWETLQDNTVRWGVPPLGVKTMKGEYLENAQTNPDISVWNEASQLSAGKDQQLEIAVKTLLEETGN